MQTKSLTVLLATVSLATAQSLADLPTCATNGAIAAIGTTGCDTTDVNCICTSQSFTSSLQSYAQANCSPQDYETAITVGQSICAAASATATSATATSASSDDELAPATTDAASVSATDPASPYANDTATVTECECEETASATKPAVVATFTGAAARVPHVGMAVVGIVGAMGLFALI